MQIIPGPGNTAYRAKVHALTQQGQAAFLSAVVTCLPLDGFTEHAGEKLRYRRAAPRGQDPRFPKVLFWKGQDVEIAGDRMRLPGDDVPRDHSRAQPRAGGPGPPRCRT
jgi:hypothetical protein